MSEAVSPRLPTVQTKLDAFDTFSAPVEGETLDSVRLLMRASVDERDAFVVGRLAYN